MAPWDPTPLQLDKGLLAEILAELAGRKRSSWAILLTCFKDDPAALPARTKYERLFTTAGGGTLNMLAYFADMSHGKLDLRGSKVFGWHRLDTKRADYVGNTYPQPAGKLNRSGLLVAARAKAVAAGVNLSGFDGTVVVGYGSTDLCGWVGGMTALCDDNSLQPSLLGQEMGHGYGLDHARLHGSTKDYNDPWDVMSTAVWPHMQAPNADYTSVGPGLNAWSMRSRGWLNEGRVWVAEPPPPPYPWMRTGSFSGSVQLRPLHHRSLAGYLAAEVGEYLVEFRVPQKWDAAIGDPCVLVHRFNPFDNRPYLMPGTRGQLSLAKGDSFEVPGSGGGVPTTRVDVVDIDLAKRTAYLDVTVTVPSPIPDLVATGILGGVVNDGGGYVILAGKIIKVPPRGPVADLLVDIARYLETDPAGGVAATAEIRTNLAKRITGHGLRMLASVETVTEQPPGYAVQATRGALG